MQKQHAEQRQTATDLWTKTMQLIEPRYKLSFKAANEYDGVQYTIRTARVLCENHWIYCAKIKHYSQYSDLIMKWH